MSAFTSLKSAIFPWRRGNSFLAASSPASEKVAVISTPDTQQKLPLDGPKCASKVGHEESAETAEKSRLPWRRQVSNGTDPEESAPLSLKASPVRKDPDETTPLSLKASSARKQSTFFTDSATSCTTVTPECSDTASALSEPEDSTDEKPSDCACKGPKFGVAPQESLTVHGLKVSSNSWAATLQARREKAQKAAETLSHEDIVGRMKSILNKLTIEKFPTLSKQLVDCGIQNTSLLEALTHEICEKATTQHHFVHMYADLCSVLQAHFAGQDHKMNFKKILLNTCQASFEKHLAPPSSLKTLKGEELAEAEQFYKLQMLGNIKFVGALIVRKILAVKVMFAIIEELLSDPTSEALESLVALLTVVGPTFDQPEFPQQFLLVAIFNQIEGRTKDRCIKYRVRCLVQDLLELRASRWQDRKPKKLEGPSTLDEVAQKFHTEGEAKAEPHPLLLWRQERNAWPTSVRHQVPAPRSEALSWRQECNAAPGTMSWRRGEPQCSTLKPAGNSPLTKAGPPSPTAQTAKKLEAQPASPNAISLRNSGGKGKATSPFEEKLMKFFEDNSVDEESCADLRACPVEIQELVLAKGDVTTARNPSAMLRVRINQAWREFKKTSKATEPEQYAKLESKCGDPTKKKKKKTGNEKGEKTAYRASEKNLDKADCFTSGKNPRKEDCYVCEDNFDEAACHKELTATYTELMTSHDVPEAVARIAAAAVPPSAQPEALCVLLVLLIEQGMDARAVGFKLIVSVFTDKHWTPAALQEGLEKFSRMYSDLKIDVPLLPKILSEEMALAFKPLVSNCLLSAELLNRSSGANWQ